MYVLQTNRKSKTIFLSCRKTFFYLIFFFSHFVFAFTCAFWRRRRSYVNDILRKTKTRAQWRVKTGHRWGAPAPWLKTVQLRRRWRNLPVPHCIGFVVVLCAHTAVFQNAHKFHTRTVHNRVFALMILFCRPPPPSPQLPTPAVVGL